MEALKRLIEIASEGTLSNDRGNGCSGPAWVEAETVSSDAVRVVRIEDAPVEDVELMIEAIKALKAGNIKDYTHIAYTESDMGYERLYLLWE